MASAPPRPPRSLFKSEPSEDSVEAEFGGDYSEDSLNVIRSLGRKGARLGEVEPSEWLPELPPSEAACKQALQQLEEYKASLDALKDSAPDARERNWTDYKRALAEGATPEELRWLKLRAYQHAMGTLRAERGAGSAAGEAPSASGAAAVTTVAAAATPAALPERDAVLRAARDALPSSSDEGEAEPGLGAGSAGRRAGLLTLQGTGLRASTRAGIGGARVAAAASVAPAAAVPAAAEEEDPGWAPSATYREEYIEEQRLEQQLASQRHQRSAAFAVSFGAALAFSAARWLWRRGRGRGGTGGAGSRTPRAAGRPGTPLPQ